MIVVNGLVIYIFWLILSYYTTKYKNKVNLKCTFQRILQVRNDSTKIKAYDNA